MPRIKALAAARAAGLPALADDSGFSVAALDGAPGVRTADWAMQPDGARDYADAMAQGDGRRAGVRGPHAPGSPARSCSPGRTGTSEGFEGRAMGHWVWPPRGAHGFGYDPMFVPDGRDGDLRRDGPGARSTRISHRARAFALLAAACLPPPAATAGR